MTSEDILNMLARLIPGGDAIPDSLRRGAVRKGKKGVMDYARSRADLFEEETAKPFSDLAYESGLPYAAILGLSKAAKLGVEGLGGAILGHGAKPKRPNPADLGDKIQVSPAAAESKKRSSVTDVVKQFLDSGGKGVIRVSGDNFSYDEEKPRPTSSSVKWTAPNMGGRMSKEEAMLKVAQANAAGKSRAEALKVMGLLGPEGTKQLAAQVPGFRIWAGLDE